MYQNILAEMARNGYTREKLATEIGISVVSLRKKIKGEIPFNINEILKILSIFGQELTFEYLFKKF